MRMMDLIGRVLGLTINRLLADGRTIEVDAVALRDATCTLVLSKGALKPRPDLSLYPKQLNLAEAVRFEGDTLVWERPEGHEPLGRPIAHGPYVFLPKGSYRLVLDADFDGPFACRVQENFGDPICHFLVAGDREHATVIHITADAPRMEICLSDAGEESRSLRFRKAEFWPI